LAATLDKQEYPQQFIASWQQESKLSVTRVHLDDFSLPDSLKQGFYSGEPLEYETDNNISIHFIVPAQKQVLIFNIPPVDKYLGRKRPSFKTSPADLNLFLYDLIRLTDLERIF
jgi:hypothetical protein